MTAAVILAAGSSSRLGQPKQRLQFRGKTLLQIAVDAAIEAGCEPVIVVLGSKAEVISNDIADRKVTAVINAEWHKGMGSSIKTGLSCLTDLPVKVNNLILMLCDQPFVDSTLLKRLIGQKELTNKEIVACTYGETIGVPAIFDKSIFHHLMYLNEQEGAKKILYSPKYVIDTIIFPSGIFDIDTPDDYNKLTSVKTDTTS